MFEDFSFSSPSSTRPPRLAFDGDDRLMVDCDSTLISPLSSRCPSPRSTSTHRFPRLHRSRSLYFRSPQPPPTSVPFPAYEHKRLSIGTLTKKLHEHTIQNPSSVDTRNLTSRPASPTTPQSASSSRFPHSRYVLTPPDTDHDDEGYADSNSSPLTSLSPSISPQPQSPFLSPTSAPVDYPFPPSTIPSEVDLPDPYSVRTHRQKISRLQCNPSDVDAIRRSLLADEEALRFSPLTTEDCHPSSLAPQQAPRRRAITLQRSSTRIRSHIPSDANPSASGAVLELSRRRKSSVGVLPSHRIEKTYHHHYGHTSGRDLHKKSEQGLRRKSLVSAALASMMDDAE